MKLDRFINRPVLSTVISVLIVILGIIGLATLPVTQYPDIAPPTVQVRATYTGANSTAVLNSVIAPLEDQINGVENMMYIQSSASNNGAADINVYFNQGTDPDMAAVNVQNRVSMAQGLLPAEVTKVGVTTQKRQNSMLMVFSLYDETDSYNIEFIENYANINLIPEIKRVKGVGDANVLGQDYSMRIWLKPDVMAQYKLVPTDVSAALAEQNIEAAPGQFGERGDQTFQYTIRYKGRLQQTNEFEDIVIKALPDGNVDLGVNVCVQVYACVKSGTVYELTGSGAVGRCKIPAAWNSGDTWSVNGKAVPAYCGADAVDSDCIVAGRWVLFTFDGQRLDFNGGGGLSSGKLAQATAAESDVLSGKKFYAGNKNLKTGTLALSGNANAAQVLSGYTFYKDNAKSKQTGSMANRGSISTTLNPGGSKSYSAGYYSGGTINCNSATSVIKTTTLNISGTWSQNTASASAPGTIVGIKSMWRNGDSSSPRSISTSGSTLSVEWDSYDGSLSLSFTVAYI